MLIVQEKPREALDGACSTSNLGSKNNLPLLNDYIGLGHLLNFSILDRESECGVIPLKKEEKSFGILK
jgi:hypothetical protein